MTDDRQAKSMRRYVTFRSRQFENKTPKPHFINERCFGEDLAKWLRDRLDENFRPGDLIQEDYGWGFWTVAGGDPYWVYVGVMEESIGEETAEWLAGIAYNPGLNLMRRLFHKPKVADLRALCHALDVVLRRDATVFQDVEWWQDEPQVGTSSAHPI
jgi:hypothetical protein